MHFSCLFSVCPVCRSTNRRESENGYHWRSSPSKSKKHNLAGDDAEPSPSMTRDRAEDDPGVAKNSTPTRQIAADSRGGQTAGSNHDRKPDFSRRDRERKKAERLRRSSSPPSGDLGRSRKTPSASSSSSLVNAVANNSGSGRAKRGQHEDSHNQPRRRRQAGDSRPSSLSPRSPVGHESSPSPARKDTPRSIRQGAANESSGEDPFSSSPEASSTFSSRQKKSLTHVAARRRSSSSSESPRGNEWGGKRPTARDDVRSPSSKERRKKRSDSTASVSSRATSPSSHRVAASSRDTRRSKNHELSDDGHDKDEDEEEGEPSRRSPQSPAAHRPRQSQQRDRRRESSSHSPSRSASPSGRRPSSNASGSRKKMGHGGIKKKRQTDGALSSNVERERSLSKKSKQNRMILSPDAATGGDSDASSYSDLERRRRRKNRKASADFSRKDHGSTLAAATAASDSPSAAEGSDQSRKDKSRHLRRGDAAQSLPLSSEEEETGARGHRRARSASVSASPPPKSRKIVLEKGVGRVKTAAGGSDGAVDREGTGKEKSGTKDKTARDERSAVSIKKKKKREGDKEYRRTEKAHANKENDVDGRSYSRGDGSDAGDRSPREIIGDKKEGKKKKKKRGGDRYSLDERDRGNGGKRGDVGDAELSRSEREGRRAGDAEGESRSMDRARQVSSSHDGDDDEEEEFFAPSSSQIKKKKKKKKLLADISDETAGDRYVGRDDGRGSSGEPARTPKTSKVKRVEATESKSKEGDPVRAGHGHEGAAAAAETATSPGGRPSNEPQDDPDIIPPQKKKKKKKLRVPDIDDSAVAIPRVFPPSSSSPAAGAVGRNHLHKNGGVGNFSGGRQRKLSGTGSEIDGMSGGDHEGVASKRKDSVAAAVEKEVELSEEDEELMAKLRKYLRDKHVK